MRDPETRNYLVKLYEDYGRNFAGIGSSFFSNLF